MRIEHLEATHIDHFQQLVEQHQQLALKLLATTLVGEHSLDLVQHLDQHFLGIADDQAAQGGAEDDHHFRWLPEHPHVAIGHGVATQDATDDDERT